MQILKQDECLGLSSNTTLTYEVGMEHDQSIWLRVTKSSGGGFLCKEWVPMAAVTDTLKAATPPFTAYVLNTHFVGKSINSPSFLMAVLRHEGLVKPDLKKRMAFTANDLDTALESFRGRISESSPPKTKRAPKKARPK